MGNKSISSLHNRIKEGRNNPTVHLESIRPIPSTDPHPKTLLISGEPSLTSAEESVLMSINPDLDGREKVQNSEKWPYSVHGRLYFEHNGKEFLGSGTVIGSRFVLTAAHNVYRRRFKQEVNKNSMKFLPSMSGSHCPYGEFRVIEYFYPAEFKISGEEDLALLVLDRDIADYTGCYGLRVRNEAEIQRKTVCVYGYPTHIRNQGSNMHHLWGMEGPFKIDEFNKFIYYEIDTSAGQNGSGVYYVENNDYIVLGVHVLNQKDGSLTNKATYLSESRVKRIEYWIKHYYQSIHQFNTLDLSGIKTLNRDIKHYVKELSKPEYNTLRHLSISSYKLVNLVLIELGNGSFSCLTSLNLEKTHLRDQEAISLSQGSFPRLTKLQLAGNFINDPGLIALSSSSMTELKYIDLTDNLLSPSGIRALARSNITNLNTLYLDKNNITDEGVRELSKGRLTHLTNLYLAENDIGDEGLIELAKGNLTSLSVLSLESNKIGDSGVIEFMRRDFGNLTSLNLRMNNIGPEGAKEIAIGNRNLSKLDLSCNKIGNEGAIAIARGNLMYLVVLYLRQNEIGEEGARELAITRMSKLKVVDLWGNDIGMKARELIMRKFREV